MKKIVLPWLLGLVVGAVYVPGFAVAQQGNFSLQVTPSPLVLSVRPGESVKTELKLRNNGDKVENLKIEPKSFNLSGDTGEVTLSDNAPSDIAGWVRFANPNFTVKPGEWFTEKITITLPKDAGFSYSFALIISRADETVHVNPGEAALKGSLAVFTLVSVDRPDAKKQLEVTEFQMNKGLYEYLPVTVKTIFKNTGNTIIQPYGNIFIQRSGSSTMPIATLPVNEGRGYILPGSTRTLTSDWKGGFPVYETAQSAANVVARRSLVWNWAHAADFRFGRYTVKLVGAYNDGHRDVPLEAETTFWVIPWKLLLGASVILLLLVVGVATMAKKGFIAVKKTKKRYDDSEQSA